MDKYEIERWFDKWLAEQPKDEDGELKRGNKCLTKYRRQVIRVLTIFTKENC